MDKRDLKAIGIGVVSAVLLSAIMAPLIMTGISPLPAPLSLAFAESVLQTRLPLPVGLLFHVAWVTFFTWVYVRISPAIRFTHALYLAAVLWVSALVVFMPIAGWGFLGLDVSPKLIVAALLPHALFAVFIWGGGRLAGLAQVTE